MSKRFFNQKISVSRLMIACAQRDNLDILPLTCLIRDYPKRVTAGKIQDTGKNGDSLPCTRSRIVEMYFTTLYTARSEEIRIQEDSKGYKYFNESY